MPKQNKNQAYSGYAFVRAETDLFSESGYDISISSSAASEYHPISTLSDSLAPIEFSIQSNDFQYIDLSETKLYIRARIVDAKGVALAAGVAAIVAPVNNALHTIFQQCSVFLNEVNITPSSNQYAYRAYIETLLAYNKDYKKSQAQCAFYYKDKNLNQVDPAVEDGFKHRYDLSKESKSFEMIGRPFSDIFAQTRYLFPGIDVRIKFQRSSDEFCLMSSNATKYKLEIQEAKLLVQKHNLLPSLMANHLTNWEKGGLISYPMRRVEIKTYTLSPGTVQSTNENLLSGLQPDRIIVGLLNATNHMGSMQTNPFRFQNFGLSYIDVSVNGDQVSSLPNHLDFDVGGQYVQLYSNIFSGLGIANDDVGLEVTLEEFRDGKTLLVYDLRHVREGFVPPKHGNVKIELKFKAALTTATTVLVYCEYQSVLQIDKFKNIFYKDYSQG
jgi:hypothetical protein